MFSFYSLSTQSQVPTKQCHENQQVQRLQQKYPDRTPVVVHLSWVNQPIKLLVPKSMTMTEIMFVIRKRIKVNADEALFFFISNKLLPGRMTFAEIEKTYSTAGVVSIDVKKESTFGTSTSL